MFVGCWIIITSKHQTITFIMIKIMFKAYVNLSVIYDVLNKFDNHFYNHPIFFPGEEASANTGDQIAVGKG